MEPSTLSTDWAYPVGHTNVNLSVKLVRGYYQPVQNRTATYCDGYELDLPDTADGSSLYAVLGGSALFEATPAGAPAVINRLTVRTTRSLLEQAEYTRGGLVLLTSTLAEDGIVPQKVLYDNVDPATLRTKLEALVQADYALQAAGQPIHPQSIVNTSWQPPSAPKARLLKELLKEASLKSPGDYASLKTAFLDSVLAPTGAIPFLLPPASNFGNAAAAGAPSGARRVRLAAQNDYDQYYNLAVLLDALIRNSNKINRQETGITCLSDKRRGADLYGTPLLTALGLRPGLSPPNVQPNADGTLDVVLARQLLTLHHGQQSHAQWSYSGRNLLFRAQVLPGSTTMTVAGYVAQKRVGTKLVSLPPVTATFQVIDSLATSAPYKTYLVGDATTIQPLVNFALATYAKYTTLIDDIGAYLGVPAELLLAVVAHESGGGKYFPVRFEPALDYAVVKGKEVPNETARTVANTYLNKIRALGPDMTAFVTQYKALAGVGGKSARLQNDLSRPADRQALIRADNPLTWQAYLSKLDTLAQASASANDKGLNYIGTRVSPGIAQTLLETGIKALNRLASFVQRRYGATSPVMSKLLLTALPGPKLSEQFLWLLNERNSLVAGAAVLLLTSGRSKWDIPIVTSCYNDSGTPAIKYDGRTIPNPWGYLLNDPEYNIHISVIYNALRVSGKPFKAVLKPDISVY
jgi:hypothetical protein